MRLTIGSCCKLLPSLHLWNERIAVGIGIARAMVTVGGVGSGSIGKHGKLDGVPGAHRDRLLYLPPTPRFFQFSRLWLGGE